MMYSSLPRPEILLESLVPTRQGNPALTFKEPMTTSDYLYKREHPPVIGLRNGEGAAGE